jgi:hypothetical protein
MDVSAVTISINGTEARLTNDSRVSLLDFLRDHLALSGTKKGCNQGACGACTVLVDGERILSCLALAVQYEGRSIITVEGLSSGAELHPLQRAFIEHWQYPAVPQDYFPGLVRRARVGAQQADPLRRRRCRDRAARPILIMEA